MKERLIRQLKVTFIAISNPTKKSWKKKRIDERSGFNTLLRGPDVEGEQRVFGHRKRGAHGNVFPQTLRRR